jgi:hypothetical protein
MSSLLFIDPLHSILRLEGIPFVPGNLFFLATLKLDDIRKVLRHTGKEANGNIFTAIFSTALSIKKKGVETQDPVITVPDGLPLAVVNMPTLFVRDVYEELYAQVTEENTPRTLLAGSSGLGKSSFLVYLAIKLLVKGEIVIFQPETIDQVYCFVGTEYSRVGSMTDFGDFLGHEKIWYLVDGDKKPTEASMKTIVALSPKAAMAADFKVFAKTLSNTIYMPPWSLDELLRCRELMFTNLPEDWVKPFFDRFGGVPRYVLRIPAEKLRRDSDVSCSQRVW